MWRVLQQRKLPATRVSLDRCEVVENDDSDDGTVGSVSVVDSKHRDSIFEVEVGCSQSSPWGRCVAFLLQG